jgi:hypothetical protein
MIKKIVIVTSCMLMCMFVGCKKEEVDPAPSSSVSRASCSPYRSVLGSDLIAELNALANCGDPTFCVFPTTTTATSPRFVNPVDNSFYGYQHSASVGTADQSTLLSMGQSFATANTPVGYHILSIEFKPSYITHFPDWFNVYVVVTYRKCR